MISQQMANAVMLSSIYMLIAVSFSIAIGALNFINFSIPGIFMVCAFVFWGVTSGGAHWLLAASAAICAGIVMSLVVERFTYRWLKTSDFFIPLVSSIAFLILFENLALIAAGSDLQVVPNVFGNMTFKVAGIIVSVPQLIGLTFAIITVAALTYTLKKTAMGRAVRAIADDAIAARGLGIDIGRTVSTIFVGSGIMAALAGIIFAVNYQQVYPLMGEEVAFKGISAMVVGGLGSIWGAVLGGVIVGFIEIFAINFLGADYVDIAVYGSLLLILLVRPTGLLGDHKIGHERF